MSAFSRPSLRSAVRQPGLWVWLLVIVLALPAWAPLTRAGLPPWRVGPLPAIQLTTPQAIGDQRLEGPLPVWVGRLAGQDRVAGIKFSAGIGLMLWAAALAGWSLGWSGRRAAVLAAVLAIYAPVVLNTLYLSGAVGVVWATAGFALAGWGVQISGWRGMVGVLLGSAGAMLAAPGLGLIALLALALLALGQRRWVMAVILALAVVGGFLRVQPLAGLLGGRDVAAVLDSRAAVLDSRAAASVSRAAVLDSRIEGVSLYQWIAPGRTWDQRVLRLGDAMDFGLGMPLLGLLAAGFWLRQRAVYEEAAAVKPRTRTPRRNPEDCATVPMMLTAGLLLLLSLDGVAARLPLFTAILPAPWTLLLPAVTLLALTAAHMAGGVRQRAVWAALLLLPVLNAGPALSPTFVAAPVEHAAGGQIIPAAPVAFGKGDLFLLRLEVESPPQPGATMILNAEWMASAAPAFDYSIFVHVLDAAGSRTAQLDTQPQAGARPMTTWLAGEVIADRYELRIPATAPADLRVLIGLYNWQTLERLPVARGSAAPLPQVGGLDGVEWMP